MSKIYAVALALVILAAPAMAQTTLTSPWDADVDINVEVAAMGELWHGANELSLAVHDGARWYGQTVNMNMLGNVDFDVFMAVDVESMPNDVFVEIVTNENGNWATDAQPFGTEAYQVYDPRPDYSRLENLVNDTTESHYFSHISADLAPQKIWSFTAQPNALTISNLYAVWSGNSAPTYGATGAVTVMYTMTQAN